jgi:hypothetical protein
MSEGDRDRVETALVGSGYVVLPEDVLWRPYDGSNEALRRFYDERHPSWFIRFFDYI